MDLDQHLLQSGFCEPIEGYLLGAGYLSLEFLFIAIFFDFVVYAYQA